MEILLVLAVLVLGLGVALMMKRKKEQGKVPTNLSVKQARPRAVAPQPVAEEASVHGDVSSRAVEAPVTAAAAAAADVASSPVESERVSPKAASPSQPINKEEAIPEDSTLRRHYLSTRQAEKAAITNPYPTDSTLRRHYDSMSALRVGKPGVSGKAENVGRVVEKMRVPEDSALRRHFLA